MNVTYVTKISLPSSDYFSGIQFIPLETTNFLFAIGSKKRKYSNVCLLFPMKNLLSVPINFYLAYLFFLLVFFNPISIIFEMKYLICSRFVDNKNKM